MVSFGQAIPSTRSRWMIAIVVAKFGGTSDNKNEMQSWRLMERMPRISHSSTRWLRVIDADESF